MQIPHRINEDYDIKSLFLQVFYRKLFIHNGARENNRPKVVGQNHL